MTTPDPEEWWIEQAFAVDRGDLRGDFHDRLDALDERLVGAGGVVVEALPRLTRAFLGGDRASIRGSERMAVDVQERCVGVRDGGFVLLARESPVGGDLRRMVAILRTTTDVERSASLLKHVCGSLRWFDPPGLPAPVGGVLAELAIRAGRVFRGGVEAWTAQDALAVTELDAADDRVDELQAELLESSRGAGLGSELIVIGLLARYFERLADHGVVLARETAFVVTGERPGDDTPDPGDDPSGPGGRMPDGGATPDGGDGGPVPPGGG